MALYIPKKPKENVNYKNRFIFFKATSLLLLSLFIIYFFSYVYSVIILESHRNQIFALFRKQQTELLCDRKKTYETRKLQEQVNKLLKANDIQRDIKACIVNSNVEMAFSSIGDNVFVSFLMYKEAKNIDELNFILAHEIGHLIHDDPFSKLKSLYARSKTARFLNIFSHEDIVSFSYKLMNLNSIVYSRKMELRADTFAYNMVKKVYDDITPQLKFFERSMMVAAGIKKYKSAIDSYNKKHKLPNVKNKNNNIIMILDSTHPDDATRINNILGLLNNDYLKKKKLEEKKKKKEEEKKKKEEKK